MSSEALDRLAQGLAERDAGFLSALGPYVLAAAALGIADDSRTLARRFDLAHALVIRELNALAHEAGLVEITGQGAGSQRMGFALTDRARALIAEVAP